MEQFFHDLYAGLTGLINIKAFSQGALKNDFYAYSVSSAVHQVQQYLDCDVYFGVAPRAYLSGCRDAVRVVNALWVDIDFKHGLLNGDVYSKLYDYSRVPSYIVESGHGLHAYWLLDKPETDLDLVERCNKALVQDLGGDPQTWDRCRLMRVPGTWNCKNPSLRQPCYFTETNRRRYSIHGFKQVFGVETIKADEIIDWDRVPKHVHIEDWPVAYKWKEIIRYGTGAAPIGAYVHPTGVRDRSACEFALAIALCGAGISQLDIASVFQDPAYGISEKTLGIKNDYARKRHVSRTVCRAAALVEGKGGSQNSRYPSEVLADAEASER